MDTALDPMQPAASATSDVIVAEHGEGPPAPGQLASPPARRGRLDRDWQKAFYVVFTVLGSLALLWALWQLLSPISGIIILFLLSAVLAFVLAAPVKVLTRRMRRRAPAILATYLLAAVVLVGGPVVLARPFIAQATALLNELPNYANELQAHVPEIQSTLGGLGIPASVDDLKAGSARAIQQSGAEVLTRLVGTAAGVGGLLGNVLLALVISFYWLADGPRLRARAHALVPVAQRHTVLFVEENVARVLGGYLCGQVVIAATIGLLAGVGCGLLGLPYAVVLGVLAGLFALIPMFGPFLSAAPALLVAVFQPLPTVLWVLLFFFAIQQVAFNILGPRVTGHAVGLHPLAALFVLLVGFQVAGILGGLFAVPIAGVLWVLIAAAYRHAVQQPVTPA
ncbi:MAG TPA: AI-2E family transporter [Chloroflexota bacterium]